jgi:hypothetical protein
MYAIFKMLVLNKENTKYNDVKIKNVDLKI